MVPLTITLLTGPATMSTVVIYPSARRRAAAVAAGGLRVVVAWWTAVSFALANPIARIRGPNGINGLTRMWG